MKTEIKFKENVQFEGRNGYFKSSGLYINDNISAKDDFINIFPITSKNKIARCLIEVPKDSIQDLITELKKIPMKIKIHSKNDLVHFIELNEDNTLDFSDYKYFTPRNKLQEELQNYYIKYTLEKTSAGYPPQNEALKSEGFVSFKKEFDLYCENCSEYEKLLKLNESKLGRDTLSKKFKIKTIHPNSPANYRKYLKTLTDILVKKKPNDFSYKIDLDNQATISIFISYDNRSISYYELCCKYLKAVNLYTIKVSDEDKVNFKNKLDYYTYGNHWIEKVIPEDYEKNIKSLLLKLAKDDEKYLLLKKELGTLSDKALSLCNHLQLSEEEALLDIEELNYNTYKYGNKEYLVLDDDEADKELDSYLDNYIEELILPEIPEKYQNHFDENKWKHDAKKQGRGCLASYDGVEYEQNNYYIYRID